MISPPVQKKTHGFTRNSSFCSLGKTSETIQWSLKFSWRILHMESRLVITLVFGSLVSRWWPKGHLLTFQNIIIIIIIIKHYYYYYYYYYYCYYYYWPKRCFSIAPHASSSSSSSLSLKIIIIIIIIIIVIIHDPNVGCPSPFTCSRICFSSPISARMFCHTA